MRIRSARLFLFPASLAALGACSTLLDLGSESGRDPTTVGTDAGEEGGNRDGSADGAAIDGAAADGAVDGATLKVVFVTAGKWSGDLGGPAGADLKCNTEASANSLSGNFVAYVAAVGNGQPWHRLDGGTWVRPDGKPVFAQSPMGTSTPSAALQLTAAKATVPAGEEVWTGASGQFGPPTNVRCSDPDGGLVWASASSGRQATYGDPVATNGAWQLTGDAHACSQLAHLYCFEE